MSWACASISLVDQVLDSLYAKIQARHRRELVRLAKSRLAGRLELPRVGGRVPSARGASAESPAFALQEMNDPSRLRPAVGIERLAAAVVARRAARACVRRSRVAWSPKVSARLGAVYRQLVEAVHHRRPGCSSPSAASSDRRRRCSTTWLYSRAHYAVGRPMTPLPASVRRPSGFFVVPSQLRAHLSACAPCSASLPLSVPARRDTCCRARRRYITRAASRPSPSRRHRLSPAAGHAARHRDHGFQPSSRRRCRPERQPPGQRLPRWHWQRRPRCAAPRARGPLSRAPTRQSGMPCSASSAVRSECSMRASATAASAGLAW